MSWFDRLLGRRVVSGVTLYHDPMGADCQEARRVLARHGIDAEELDIRNEEAVRDQMEDQLGRVAVPAILIGGQVYWGFEETRSSIAAMLGVREEDEQD